MQIDSTIETSDGKVQFRGLLEGQELDYVIQTGLQTLMYNGLLPIAKKSVDLHVPENTEVQ